MAVAIKAGQNLASKWWIFLLDGCLLVLMGLLLLIAPYTTAVAFISVVGYLLILGAIVGVFAAAQETSEGASSAVRLFMPIIAAGIGIVLILDPQQSVEILVTLVGIATLIAGALQVAAGIGLSGHQARGLLIVMGCLSFCAGILMLLIPNVMIIVLSIFFGIQFLFAGAFQISASGRLRALNH